MIAKLFIKFSLLIIIIIGLNFIYNYTFYNNDLVNKLGSISNISKQQTFTDILYFGESSNFTFREDDSITANISEITNLFYPDLKLITINKAATHSGIFKYWLTQINLAKNLPKAIVITLNLRSFDAAWRHSKLEANLPEWLILKQPYPNLLNRFSLSLYGFEDITDQQREFKVKKEWAETPLILPFSFKYKTVREWDQSLARDGLVKINGNLNKEKTHLACHYVKSYAFNLNAENKRIKDFDEIANWCNKNKINLYLNLMAENIEYADSLVGKELVFLMQQNRDYLVKRYNKNNCVVVDNLELVKGKYFIDQNWTTEHYNYKGRMVIAKNLAKALNKQFKKEYKQAY